MYWIQLHDLSATIVDSYRHRLYVYQYGYIYKFMQCFIFLRQMKDTVCSFIQQPASYINRYCQRHREIQMICLRAPCISRAKHDSVRMSLQFGLNSLSQYPLSFVHPQWRKYQTRCYLHVYNAENMPLHSDNGSDSRQR